MPEVNPNTLTPTRIPSAYISSTTLNNPGGASNVLRTIDDNGTPCRIVMGPKKGYQYIKGENWRAGVTPIDNGYYNDGISPGHDASAAPKAPSRYYDPSYPSVLFEWWNKYVIYCHGGSTTGPNGNDNLEVFLANNVTELINITNNVLNASTTDEVGALTAIANSNDILCTNTHYPDIPINVGASGATYSLKLLLDFGFIPCYPKGGHNSYDISNNPLHNMVFTSDDKIAHEPETVAGLNCLGGCLKFTNTATLDYGYIPYQSDLYPQNTTINTWVKVTSTTSNRCIIDTTGGWTSGIGKGYQLWIQSDQVLVVVLTSTNVFTWASNSGTISPNTWYNITVTISTDPANINTEVSTVISTDSVHSIASNTGTAPGGQGGNTNDFVIGVKNSTPKSNPFNSYMSLVSVHEGALNNDDISKLWSAYAQCTPKPLTSPGAGRYAAY